ncbi:MAG: hypothetical protein NVSMB46_09640 [Candidatus Saccharimonadales bacterium]
MKLAKLHRLRRDMRWYAHELVAWLVHSKLKIFLAIALSAAFAIYTPLLGLSDTLIGIYAINVVILGIPSFVNFAVGIALIVDIPLMKATHHENLTSLWGV